MTYVHTYIHIGVSTARHKSQGARAGADRPSSSLPTMWMGSVSGMYVCVGCAHACVCGGVCVRVGGGEFVYMYVWHV